MRKEMNKNFRVKFNRLLVGYSGLCSLIGVDRANVLISRMLRTNVQSKQFKVRGNIISFYCKLLCVLIVFL